jgi:hypothetical protein
MKCDVCGEELANSEEVKAHMEREHPLDERGEQLPVEPSEEKAEENAQEPEPIVRPVR